MRLKEGVRAAGMRPEIALAASIADAVYRSHGYDLVITSLLDGKHSATSLHYSGAAMDLRTRHLKAGDADAIVTDLSDALGQDYDVVLESDHIHVEFQPGPLS